MSNALAILAALGGIVVFLGAVVAVIRAIFKQIGATNANTAAVRELSLQMGSVNGRLDNHETRISHLEGSRM